MTRKEKRLKEERQIRAAKRKAYEDHDACRRVGIKPKPTLCHAAGYRFIVEPNSAHSAVIREREIWANYLKISGIDPIKNAVPLGGWQA